MTYKIAFANQKGGVGKTTSAVSIGAELAKLGRKVLLLDLDPQCSATSGVGCQPISGAPDIYDLFLGNVGLEKVIIPTPIENLDLIPSSRDLVSLEVEIGKKPGRELILKTGFSLLTKEYDYVLMDCPPSRAF